LIFNAPYFLWLTYEPYGSSTAITHPKQADV